MTASGDLESLANIGPQRAEAIAMDDAKLPLVGASARMDIP
jgi:hypothetical protein